MGEYIAHYLSGTYGTDDVEALLSSRHGLTGDADIWARDWPGRLPTVLTSCERLLPNIMNLLRVLTLHVAPLDGDVDLLGHVEGAIGRHYKNHKEEATPRQCGPTSTSSGRPRTPR